MTTGLVPCYVVIRGELSDLTSWSARKHCVFWHRNEDMPLASRNTIKQTVIGKDLEAMFFDVWSEVSETGGILGIIIMS